MNPEPQDNLAEASAIKRATRWNRENTERRHEIQKRYRLKNADKIRAWRDSHKKELALSHKIYQQENAVKVNTKNRLWAEKNKDKTALYGKNYYLKNKVSHALRVKKWRQEHPVEAQLMGHNRRVKMHGIRIIKEEICNWNSRICGICNETIDDSFHIDHIVPLSRGGQHAVSNLQLTHPTCNVRKSTKFMHELQGVAW